MANPRFDEIGTTSSTSDTSTASDTSNTNDAGTLRKLTAKGNRKLDKKTVKPKSKTVVTPGTKVSQATIDKIKGMGMKKALAGAGGASAEMREGLKRLYGAKRVGAAAPAKLQSAKPQLGGGYVASSNMSAPKAVKNNNPYGGFSMLARGLGGSGKTDTKTTAFKADQAKLKAAYDKAKAKGK